MQRLELRRASSFSGIQSSQDDCRLMIVLDHGQSWMRSCTNVSSGFLAELAAAL